MSTIQPTDNLLVNRAGVNYRVAKSAVMSTVQDSDLLLVNRAGVDYKATFADVKKGFGPQLVNPKPGDVSATPAFAGGTGTQADPFIITPSTVGGAGGTAQSAQQITVTGVAKDDIVEFTDLSTGAGTRFKQPIGLVPGTTWTGRLVYEDKPPSGSNATYTGDLQLGTTYFRWVVTQQTGVAPDISAVTLSDVPGGDRYTSVAFPIAVEMAKEGQPTSTKKLKAYVEGTLQSAAQSSAITKATEVIAPGGFAVKQYSGNGGTQTISGLTFSPDFVWIKARNAADHHALFDTSRGATYRLFANSTSNEVQNTDMLTSFNSDGFSLGNDTAVNGSGRNHVAYAWDAGSSAVTNTDGTIASQVRANPSAGFSVVTYAGNNTARASIGHGLGTPPSVILLKNRSKNNVGWPMYHASIGTGKFMQFNVTDAVYNSFNGYTSVTSSTFTVEDDSWTTPKDTSDYVAYCFAPVAGFSSFGTFNGGDAVTCGFSPALVMVKRTDGTSDWEMVDKLGGTAAAVWPNKTDQAGAATVITGLTSTGFTTTGTGTYIYAAWNDILKGVDLEFTDNTSLANFVAGEAVTEVGNADDGTGTVSAVNAAAVPPTMKLAAPGGTWDVGSAVKGPLKAQANVKLFCKLNTTGAVTDLQSADPGFTAWPTTGGPTTYNGTLTFPALLPSGAAPDADMPAGTHLKVEVEASNATGTDTQASATITPA